MQRKLLFNECFEIEEKSLISSSKIFFFFWQVISSIWHSISSPVKLLEVRQKYSAARRISNSLLSVSSGDETLRLTLYILLVFSVTPFKIVQNKNQNRSMDEVRNLGMKGGEYTKFLAKIQARRISRIRDIRRNVLPKFIEICMETTCWCPPGWAPTWRTETNKNIGYRVLIKKRVFIPRGTHKH